MIWLSVFPTLTVINLALGDWLKTLSPVVRTFVLATIAVPIVIYGLMPYMHRLRARLMTAEQRRETEGELGRCEGAAQRSARITGVLFLITFVTSIAALALYQPVLDDPVGYIAGSGVDSRIYLAALLELMLIVANIGTAVVPFPTLRRQNESLAVGYITARIMECVFIGIGILAVLAVVTLAERRWSRCRIARRVCQLARCDQGLDVPARALASSSASGTV